ncbi:MAG: GNAT family N-acetyltransferase [Coleofasciculus sp. G1-WW12-02]|uniref:GNAT family N-acetyltransferase n=1 Tax=Coleofasciculus sp. G1-WW12-02 TaxID=3068483 RepID=UPI0032FCD556
MHTSQPTLPANCVLRRAYSGDRGAIFRLVLGAKLDPTQLRWQQFWVIECQGQVVACGQLRQFADAQELGSLVVARRWRDRGLATLLMHHLIAQASFPLYLECLGTRLAQFYRRFGFVPVSWQELPRSLKIKFGLSRMAKIILRLPVEIMHLTSNCQ